MSFIAPFEIENHNTCEWDYLEIRDGVNDRARRLLRACGDVTPGSVTSTGNG